MCQDTFRIAYTDATRPTKPHHPRYLPGHGCRKLMYASQAWWGYSNAADRARLEGFLRRCVQLGFRLASSLTLASVCDEADDHLFTRIINNPRHLLRHLPWPAKDEHYNLRKRSHCLQLHAKTSSLSDNGFIKRMLCKNIASQTQALNKL